MHIMQILGGQPWPNYLPLLAFAPKHVTFLGSSDPHGKFMENANAIQKAAQSLGIKIKLSIVSTKSQQPSIAECKQAIAHLSPDIINLTAGTKPMCLAAYLHAAKHKIPSFYLDTRRPHDQAFEFTDSAPWPHSIPSMNTLANRINVRNALMAQGFPVPSSFQAPADDHLRFSVQAAKLRSDPSANSAINQKLHKARSQFLTPNHKFIKGGKLRSALKHPLYAEPGTHYHTYLNLAAEHQIVEPLSASEFFLTTLDPVTAPTRLLRSIADTNFKLLEGIWLELALYHFLQNKNFFSDICWNVEAKTTNADSIGETDLVAFNSKTLNLHFISCKTSSPHGNALDHIQGLRRRANKEGGKFSKAELWIFAPKSEDSKQSLTKHCMEQNVSLHILSEELTE